MKNRLGSRLLSLKLTAQFIIFGILVSYFSLILSVYSAGNQIFENFTKDFIARASASIESGDGEAWLEQMFITDPERGRALLNHIREISPLQDGAVASFALYRNAAPGRTWEEVFSDGDRIDGSDVGDENWTAMLESARREGYHFKHPLYLGQEGHRIYLVNTTPPNSDYDYVAAVRIAHLNIFHMVIDEWDRFKFTTLSVVIFSLVLGQIFAYPLSHSVRKLTDNALAVSRGDENVSFTNGRLDDVGVLSRAMDRMTHNLRHRARTLKTMNRIDRAVLSSLSREELLGKVADYIAEQFPESGVAILEREEEAFHILALLSSSQAYSGTHLSYEEFKKPVLSPADIAGIDLSSHRSLRTLFGDEGLKRHTVAYPLIVEDRTVGSVLITRDRMTEEDRDTLRMLADQGGVALKSLSDAKSREELYEGMLLSLTRTIDAKSRWTGGHSERVTRLAMMMGHRLNGERAFLDMIRIGGHLHDIGKLAIPEAILDKPGKLDDGEYNQIKAHPVRGDEILSDIPGFDIARSAVRSHHERWDGKGYPDGLAGENIPFIARIIMICDVYDAITEDRPYRKGFSRKNAREFMVRERGTMFDPELLDLFLELPETGEMSGNQNIRRRPK